MENRLWPKRIGSDGKVYELTIEDKLDLLAESISELSQAILFVAEGASIKHLYALEQLWADCSARR